MTKMVVTPINSKNLWNLPLRNQTADKLETWYATLVAPALSSLFKWWPLVDVDFFYSNVKFGHLGLFMGKRWSSGCYSLWHQRWFMQSITWTFINATSQGHLSDIFPWCPRFSNFNFLCKTASLIESKLHVEPLWDRGITVCTVWDLVNMTKMAAMSIYINLILRAERLIALKLGMQHWDSDPTKFVQW